MATYTSTSGNYKTTLTVTETATSIPNNTSTLSWSLKVERIGGASSQYGIYNGNQCPWSVSINGSRVGSGTFSYDFRYTGSYNLGSGNNVTVAHNNDGTKTGVAVSGTVDLDNSAYVSVMTASGTIDLTTIPRASDISLSVGSYNVTSSSGNAFTYTITAKSTSFYNRLRYTLGSTNYTGSGSTGSRSGNFTNAELLNSLPTATSGSLTAYVDTATDSGFTNIIGTNSVSIPISINTSYIKPSLTLQNLSVNSSPISGYAVAGYSKVQCGTSSSKWSASGGYGTNAITVTFTTSHGSLAQSSYSASSNSISNYTVSNVLPSSSSNYTLTISATARDSRGATSSASKTYTVYGYTPPTANLTAYRVASSSSTTEDGAGTYAYVTFSGAVSSSVNSQNTIQSTTCTYSGSISGTATSGGHYALADTQTVTFTLTVRDKVTSSATQKTINTASYPLDLYDNGSGSVGVGFGKVAVAGIVDSAMPFRVGQSFLSSSQLQAGSVTLNENTYCGPHSLAGKIFLRCSPNATDLKALSVMNNAGTYKDIVSVDQNNNATFVGSLSGNATSANSATNATNSTNANNAQRLRSYNFTSNTENYYCKLGTLVHNGDGKTTEIIVYTGQGFNAGAQQQGWARVQIKNAWQSTASATNAFGITYQVFGFQMSSFEVVGIATDYQTLQVWVKLPWAYGSGNYIVMGYYDSWTSDGTTTSSTVPSGTQQNRTKINSDESIVLWTGTLQGGASTLTLPSIVNYCRRVKIYAYMAGELNMIWEVDLSKLDASTARHVNHSEPIYISNPGGWYMTTAQVKMTKTTLQFESALNIRFDGTNHIVTQNGSNNYIIYRIDGIV